MWGVGWGIIFSLPKIWRWGWFILSFYLHRLPAMDLVQFILNSNLAKSRLPITHASVDRSLWNFAQGTEVSLPCPVQIFKAIRQLKRMSWTNEISRELVLVTPHKIWQWGDYIMLYIFTPHEIWPCKVKISKFYHLYIFTPWNLWIEMIAYIHDILFAVETWYFAWIDHGSAWTKFVTSKNLYKAIDITKSACGDTYVGEIGRCSVITVITGSFGTNYCHYDDVIVGARASQITSLAIIYSTAYSDADQRKHQSSASLAFVRGIHRGPVNSPHKWPVTPKMFPFHDVIMVIEKL